MSDPETAPSTAFPWDRLPAALGASGGVRRVRGDGDGNLGLTPVGTDGSATAGLREAAVLVPLVDRGAGPTVILTQRTAHLAAHAGQISFPGGRIEPDDPGSLAGALRETDEEIGLPSDRIDILGRLDTYVTRTGFRIVPWVGRVQPPVPLSPDPFEVAEVFEVPMTFLLGPGMPQRHSKLYQGVRHEFWAFPYRDRYIWGATAGMLVDLRERLLALATPVAAAE